MAPPERVRPAPNIRDEKELAHFEKIKITERKIPSSFRTIDRKITLGVVLLYKHGALRVI